MSADNPYAAPEAELIPVRESEDTDLADRGTRFVSAFLDSLVGLATGLPILYAVGFFDAMSQGRNPSIGMTLLASGLSFLVFLAVQGYFLKTSGQTLGKKAKGIKIVDLDGNLPDFGKLILLRYLPMTAAAQVPVVGPFASIADVLFIFRGDRRCVHDLLAGTKVVNAKNRH